MKTRLFNYTEKCTQKTASFQTNILMFLFYLFFFFFVFFCCFFVVVFFFVFFFTISTQNINCGYWVSMFLISNMIDK